MDISNAAPTFRAATTSPSVILLADLLHAGNHSLFVERVHFQLNVVLRESLKDHIETLRKPLNEFARGERGIEQISPRELP